MSYNISYICRLCLTSSEKNISIFGDEGMKNNIQSKIWRLFSFMVQEGENLPKYICCQCWKHLEFIFSFISKVEEAQKKMYSLKYDITKSEIDVGSIEHYLGNDQCSEQIFGDILSAPVCTANQPEQCNGPLSSSTIPFPVVSDQCSPPHSNSGVDEQIACKAKDELDLDFLDSDSDDGSDEDYEDNAMMHLVEVVQEENILTNQASCEESKPVPEGDSNSSDSESGDSLIKNRRLQLNKSSARAVTKTKPERDETESNPVKPKKKGKSSWDPNKDKQIENFYEFTCELCPEQQRNHQTFNLLCKHYKSVHLIEGYLKCCKRKMYCRSHLYNHMILHTQPELYKCPECDKQLCSPVNLKQHLQLFHLPKTDLPYRCSMCGRGFATKAAVENHEKSQHLLSEEEKFIHVCDICGKRFSSAPGVTEHKKQVHAQIKPLLCDICAKAFPNRSRLCKHMTSHNDSENLKCPHCDRRLKNYVRLQVHLKCHQGVIHSCPHCDKTYPTRRLLQRHIKTHSDARPHACSVCGKRYRESSHLKMHFNQHTGALPFNCQWCPKRFSASGPFYTHRKKMHPKELAQVNAGEVVAASGN